MKLSEIKTRLNTLGLPVAYLAFKKKTSPPFIVYFVENEKLRGNDEKHLIVERSLIIEFYSDDKDEATEKSIEDLFPEYEIAKNDVWISDENMLQVTFNINCVFKR